MDGEFGCYEWYGKPSLLNQRVCRLQEFSDLLLPKFLFYGINKYLQAIEKVTSFTTVKHISSNQILAIDFPIPPLPEQHCIVTILDQAFEAIAIAQTNTEKNLKNAQELFESQLEAVFSQQGEGWKTILLGKIATFRNGINFTKSSEGISIKMLGVKDFQNHYWAPFEDFESIIPNGIVPDSDILVENDIVFVRSNGNFNLIGRCLLVGETPERVTHSGFTIRSRLNSKDILPTYLCHFLKSKNVR
ncbi:hypothetical protein NURINAE_00780 [Candidatus Nitrosacidococcus sp. I8]|nr:hypothetical protein NURINAE_00780 [Candidatus Nitrosacidococcus sp. I8]